MPRFIYVVLCLVTAVMMLSACAEDGKDGRNGIDFTPAEEAAMTTRGCLTCHSDYKAVVEQSQHMNIGRYELTGPYCNACHSPNLGYLDIAANANSGVSCTGCHELNTMIKDNPIHSSYEITWDKCITCHKDVVRHGENETNPKFFPYAENIAGDFGTVENSYPGHSFASGKAIRDGDPRACGLCHSSKVFANIANKVSPRKVESFTIGAATVYRTSGGAHEKLYQNFGTLYSVAAKALNLDRESSDAVGCDGCHQPHSTKLLTDGNQTATVSAEFLLCTSCHLANVELKGAISPVNGTVSTTQFTGILSPLYTGAVVDGILQGADASLFEHHGLNFTTSNQTHSIMDTHFAGDIYSKYTVNANGTVTVDNSTVISVAGYGIRVNAANPCTSCHNVHASSIFEPSIDNKSYKALTESWSKTMHGMQVRTTNCVPCHAAGREYASVLLGQPKPTSGMGNTQISCLTCHMGDYERVDGAAVITGDNAKKLRFAKNATEFNRINAGIMQEVSQAEYDAIKAQYPIDNAMLCGGCHTGGSGGTVQSAFRDATTGNISTAGGHWKMSFGFITGLALDLKTNLPVGKTYNLGFRSFHVASVNEKGCLSCHNSGSESHSFSVFADDAKTILATTNPTCLQCHGNGIIDSSYRTQVNAARDALYALVPSTANAFVNLTKYPDTDPANAEIRKKMGMAIGNIRVISRLRIDQGLFAHSTKRFLQEFFYDNLLVIKDQTGLVFTNGNIDFTNALKMTGAPAGADTGPGVTSLEQTNKDALTAFFTGFTR